MTHGAKNGGSFSEMMGPSISFLTTVDIWVVYFTYTLTQTICMLTADYAVKPVFIGHSKKKTNYLFLQVKSIAECSKGSILQSFQPSLSYHLLLRSLFFVFLSGCLRQVLLYWLPTCTFCFAEFEDSL